MFKNFKSSCFNIEKTKIKNYARAKKMLFIYLFAYAIYLFVGDLIRNTSHIKKNFKNHLNLFSLFSLLRKKAFKTIPNLAITIFKTFVIRLLS